MFKKRKHSRRTGFRTWMKSASNTSNPAFVGPAHSADNPDDSAILGVCGGRASISENEPTESPGLPNESPGLPNDIDGLHGTNAVGCEQRRDPEASQGVGSEAATGASDPADCPTEARTKQPDCGAQSQDRNDVGVG